MIKAVGLNMFRACLNPSVINKLQVKEYGDTGTAFYLKQKLKKLSEIGRSDRTGHI
jgi:hypothetical protein